MRWRAAAWTLLAAAATLVYPGCGGGGSDGGGGGPTMPPTPTPIPTITFTPSGTGGANSLALTRVSSDATSLVLSLEATSVTDLYGIAFDLSYPSDALTFRSATEGTFLDQNNTVETSLQVAEMPTGTLVVGLSRLGELPGRTGTGTLLRLEFARRATGSGSLFFAKNQAFNANGAAISGVVWSAGSVTVP